MSTSDNRALKQSPTGTSSTDNRSKSDSVSTADEDDLSTEDLWDGLSNARRRQTVRYLATHEDVTIGDLADDIAARENDCEIAQLDADQRKRVYIGLYQVHLKNLDRAGVIDYNQARGDVDRGEHFVRAHAALEGFTDALSEDVTEPEDAGPTGIVGRLTAALGGEA